MIAILLILDFCYYSDIQKTQIILVDAESINLFNCFLSIIDKFCKNIIVIYFKLFDKIIIFHYIDIYIKSYILELNFLSTFWVSIYYIEKIDI